MMVKNKWIVVLTALIFCSISCSNQPKFEGTWKLVLVQVHEYHQDYPYPPTEPANDKLYWNFDKNTLAKLYYPLFLDYDVYTYTFNDDSLFIDSEFSAETYRYEFKDDTMKLTLYSNGGGHIYYYYFIPVEADSDIIADLRKNGVNWPMLSGQWEFVDYFPSHPKEGVTYDAIKTPRILDLTEANKSNYQFANNLIYTIDGTELTLRFRDYIFISDSILLLEPVYDESMDLPEQYVNLSLGYKRM